MIFEPKTVTLKNNQTAILKTPPVEDAPKMLDYVTQACGETEFLARYPEEWSCISVESEEKWIRGARDGKNKLIITCYVDGRIVGNSEIDFLVGKKIQHRATLAIAILKDYWGLGIGSALFTELLAAANQHSGTEIAELEFIEGNGRAKHLYEKFGFEVVSERPNAFRLRDGSYRSEIFMQKKL